MEELRRLAGETGKKKDVEDEVLLLVCEQGQASWVEEVVGGCSRTYRTQSGNSAMHIAARNGSAATIAALLRHGWDPAVKNSAGDTPLMFATAGGSSEAVRLLLEDDRCRDGVDDVDVSGHNALFIGVLADANEDCVMELLRAGCHPGRKDAKSRTALDVAKAKSLEKPDDPSLKRVADSLELRFRTLEQEAADAARALVLGEDDDDDSTTSPENNNKNKASGTSTTTVFKNATSTTTPSKKNSTKRKKKASSPRKAVPERGGSGGHVQREEPAGAATLTTTTTEAEDEGGAAVRNLDDDDGQDEDLRGEWTTVVRKGRHALPEDADADAAEPPPAPAAATPATPPPSAAAPEAKEVDVEALLLEAKDDPMQLLRALHPQVATLAIRIEDVLLPTPALSTSQLEAVHDILDSCVRRVVDARILAAVQRERRELEAHYEDGFCETKHS